MNRTKKGHTNFLQQRHHIIKLTLPIFLITTLGIFLSQSSFAQRIGEQAEMERLAQQADDLASQDDPNGAAQTIGKAAMMAKIITEQNRELPLRLLFESVEIFFRGQEYAYRALAIFQQTGGQPPAPQGVCQFFLQAEELMTQSHRSLTELTNLKPPDALQQQKYKSQLQQWQAILPELNQDLSC